jgi:hypothetical protein
MKVDFGTGLTRASHSPLVDAEHEKEMDKGQVEAIKHYNSGRL